MSGHQAAQAFGDDSGRFPAEQGMRMSEHTPREAALKIIYMLQKHDHVAYLAGGCVRDRVMGLEPKDHDIATDAHPERIRELIPNSQFIGEAFGVVLIRMYGYVIEVATFRSESGYSDHRHPDHVDFTDARTDAMRRDFTINGLFENPFAEDDEPAVIDFVGGQADINGKVIRAIGQPIERIREDALRMLRAVRFAARLGFEIEPRTARAIQGVADELAHISRERIGQEVKWSLTGPRPVMVVQLIQHLKLDNPTLLERSFRGETPTVKHLSPNPPYGTALAAWLIDRHLSARGESITLLLESMRGGRDKKKGKANSEAREQPRSGGWFSGRSSRASSHRRRSSHRRSAAGGWFGLADSASGETGRAQRLSWSLNRLIGERLNDILHGWRQALCLSNDDTEALRMSVTLLPGLLEWRSLSVANRKRLLAQGYWSQAWLLLRALRYWPGVSTLIEPIERDSVRYYDEGIAPPPLVTGDALVALGYVPGPGFGRVLEMVYDAQLDGLVTTQEQALAWAQRRL